MSHETALRILYPTIKFNEHWAVTAALQSYSRPYFLEALSLKGYGIHDGVLQATLNYARVSERGALLLRAGVLPASFGSFLMRYDEADNALAQLPAQYAYYKPVSTRGLIAAQVDASRGRWDGLGADVAWSRGDWDVRTEVQTFKTRYHANPELYRAGRLP